MSNEVVKKEGAAVAVQAQENAQPMSIDQLKNRVVLIQGAMKSVMKDGEDYGTVPGCGDKPTLLEPGAEKLMCLFRLSPRFEREMKELPNGHREYNIKCSLYASDGTFAGEGLGCALTTESKWRFRSENTGREVPREYWDSRNPEFLGGSQFSARKVKSKDNKDRWVVFHKVEHDNPADYFNTCLKMAAKRAKVAAARQATGASFLFSQDLDDEDIRAGVQEPDEPPPSGPRYQHAQAKPQGQQQSQKPAQQAGQQAPQQQAEPKGGKVGANPISGKQAGLLVGCIKRDSGQDQEWVMQTIAQVWGYVAVEAIDWHDFNPILNWVKSGCDPQMLPGSEKEPFEFNGVEA